MGDNPDAGELKQVVKFMECPPTLQNLKTPKKLKTTDDDNLVKTAKFALGMEDLKSEMSHLQLSDHDLLELKASRVPSTITNVIMGITSVLEKLNFQIREIQGELLQKAMLQDVSVDLTGLTAAMAGLKSSIGTNSNLEHPDIWSALDALEEKMSVEFQKLGISDKKIEEFEQKFSKSANLLYTYGNRWAALNRHWIPLVKTLSVDLKSLQEDHTQLKMSANTTDDTTMDNLLNLGRASSSDSRLPSVVTSRLNSFHDEIEQMNDKMGEFADAILAIEQHASAPENSSNRNDNQQTASGVSFKDHYFPDEDAVKQWMKTHMTLPSHGLFVDIVSFSEFFGGDRYVERNTTLNDLYMSNKIGYATMADSIVAASFQNVLPGAYGRNPNSSSQAASSSDLQAQPELPGLKSFQKWDNQDGSTGRKYWIKKEARSTLTQIDGMIRQQLSNEAQYLARDLLTASATMSEEMFNFISTSYEDTMHSGRFDTDQAWALTSKFVKRIFTEIANARVVARDGVHVNDPWTTAAKFVFATLKAHVVMQDFMRLDIKDHPSISSEMVKFICYSQPSHDSADLLDRLSTAEALMRTNQGAIAKLDSRLKKLETHRVESDKLLKKLKEHANL